MGVLNFPLSVIYNAKALHNQHVPYFTTVQALFPASLCPSEYADGPTFVCISLTKEEVEHVSHMNRDDVCSMVV